MAQVASYPICQTGVPLPLPQVEPSSRITPVIFPGTGTGGWETALQNTLSPGDKVVTFTYGMFSKLWVRLSECCPLHSPACILTMHRGAVRDRARSSLVADAVHIVPPFAQLDMLKAMQLDVVCIEQPWGQGADEAQLAEALKVGALAAETPMLICGCTTRIMFMCTASCLFTHHAVVCSWTAHLHHILHTSTAGGMSLTESVHAPRRSTRMSRRLRWCTMKRPRVSPAT